MGELVARLCAVTVGAVLAVAGAGKVTAWSAWSDAARRQNLPKVVAVLVPPFELILGAWLVAFDPSPVPLGLATCLLIIFTVFLAVELRTGSTVPCACFGARSARPPRRRDLARNVALIALLAMSAVLAGS